MRGPRPWLWLPADTAHKLSPLLLKGLAPFVPKSLASWQPFSWRGIHFKNRLGLAGGVDKDARNIGDWARLGCAFVEVGTITPMAQTGNSGVVVGRYPPREALWNRLGFPSQGMLKVGERLKQAPREVPIFANIGKNASTPLAKAQEDYIKLLNHFKRDVDAFVINISSPNTSGLRELLKPENFQNFLKPIMQSRGPSDPPVLLKLSPDMADSELAAVLETSAAQGVEGWVVTNTTLGLRDQLPFPPEGGISGRPLAPRAKHVLEQTLKILGPKKQGKLVIAVGGIMSPEDVQERLAMGADLVQVYSALIYSGPFFFRKVAKWQQRKSH